MITQEQITEKENEVHLKAEELSKQLNVKVHAICFVEDDEFITGFMREPDRMVKTKYLDKAVVSLASAAGELLEVCLLREHSDSRILTNDNHYFGACAIVNTLVQASQNVISKKK